MSSFFRTWLPQMVGYAETISEETQIREAWLSNDLSKTSISYPGELFAQLFDDMNAGNMDTEIETELSMYDTLKNSLKEFIRSVMLLESWVNAQSPYPSAQDVLSSVRWKTLRDAASAAVDAARDAGFRSTDFNP